MERGNEVLMKIFRITKEETVEFELEVEANSEDEALEIAHKTPIQDWDQSYSNEDELYCELIDDYDWYEEEDHPVFGKILVPNGNHPDA